jgi:cell division protein FtsL
MAMHSARVMLEERVKLLEENKDLVVDYARLEQLEQANAAIMDVVLKMNSVTEELDKLVSGIATPLP